VAEGDLLSNKVEVNLNMFRPLMLHGVAGEINNTDIVAIDQGSMAKRVAKLKKQLT
jgi:hypothetical protein